MTASTTSSSTKISLHYTTLRVLKTISNEIIISHSNDISFSQAFTTLKNTVIFNIKRTKIFEQIKFIKQCVHQKLYTTRITAQANRLEISKTQKENLKAIITKNIRTKLFTELAGINKQVSAATRQASMFTTPQQNRKIRKLTNIECKYIRTNAKKHFRDRINWMEQKQQSSQVTQVPTHDGIDFRDQTLGAEFVSQPCVYER